MVRLVAFLRGINVGGRVVKKEKLQEGFAALGFEDVATYKQSGNVVFETATASLDEVRTDIEDKLQKTLGYNVAVFVRTFTQLRKVVAYERLKRGGEDGTSLLVTFLPGPNFGPIPALPLTIPKSTAIIVAATDSEVYSLTHGGGEGALPNPFLKSKLKAKTTTRNKNVIKEIIQRYSQGVRRPKT